MRLSRPVTIRAQLFGALGAATLIGAAPVAASPMRFATADVAGSIADTQSVTFDVFLPLRDKPGLEALLFAQQNPTSPFYHHWMTPAQFASRFGATDATFAAVTAELTAQAMHVQRWSRSLHVTATAADLRRAFDTDLSLVRGHNGDRIVSLSGLSLTPALLAAQARVFAFLPRRAEAHPNSRIVATALPFNRTSVTGGYDYNDLKQAYAYPAVNAIKAGTTAQRLDGTGATIGVLMSADVNDADTAMMFSAQNYAVTTGQAAPQLYRRVLVDGGSNTSSSAFDEASLDVQMEIGGAPGAHVVLYEIPALSDADVIDGYTRIIQDNLVDAVSSSFGECELDYTAAYNDGTDDTPILAQEHELFQQGNAQGISFLASSGDAAGKQCPSLSYIQGGNGKFQPGASSPATDPDVTGVGGTNLLTSHISGSLNAIYVGENAYSDPEQPYDPYDTGKTASGGVWGAGGGASIYFATPSWQTRNGASMRTTPDIGMQVGGCPSIARIPCNGGNTASDGNGNTQRSFTQVVLNNTVSGLIGTSVASPEFASVVALMVELHGRQGNLNPYLYALRGTAAFHTLIPGYNGIQSTFTPSASYNYSVGLGTPVVDSLIAAPSGTTLAGVPQTVSNP